MKKLTGRKHHRRQPWPVRVHDRTLDRFGSRREADLWATVATGALT